MRMVCISLLESSNQREVKEERWLAWSLSNALCAGASRITDPYLRFNSYHHEKVQSAMDRYSAELKRILGVLESHLSGTAATGSPREWLVGDKMTYADLAFVTWNNMVDQVLAIGHSCDALNEFPHVAAWH